MESGLHILPKRRRPILGPLVFLVAGLFLLLCWSGPLWATNAIVYENGKPVWCENYWTTIYTSSTDASRCGGSTPPTGPSGDTFPTPHVASIVQTSILAENVAALLSFGGVGLAVLPRPERLPRVGLVVGILVLSSASAGLAAVGPLYFQSNLPPALHADNFSYLTGYPGALTYAGSGSVRISANVTETWTWGPVSSLNYPFVGSGLVLSAGMLTGWSMRRRLRPLPP